MPRDVLFRPKREPEFFAPEPTPARLLCSWIARARLRDAAAEVDATTPWRISDENPALILDALGQEVEEVTRWDDDASNARVARIIVDAINAATYGAEVRL